jgi:O-antigen/teichoic acid export membrane protein
MSKIKRIAKNTLMLYFRQIFIMLVSLYTVRAVLETLGTEDYGIYNVVAGVVTMFSFLSGSMATASQRYFSFEIGRGDFEQLRKVFSLNFLVYMLIAVLILALSETIGLWFVINKLVIPEERMEAARWVYHFSILSFLFTVLTIPYMAAIIAHEDMNIYAYVSIIEAVLKLGIVLLLRTILLDKLQLYGILLCAVALINTTIYRMICKKKYQECNIKFYWDKDLCNEIMTYTGWNMFGASVNVFKQQAVNILLNQFFNPVIVAARGIASQINTAVISFSHNFSAVIRPQIIKSYAAGQKNKMLTMMFYGAKGTYFLMYVFTLPLVLEMPVLLAVWLKNPPEYTVLFTRLSLIDALIDSVSLPIMAAAQATGKIKLYQSIVGGILLLNLPVSWMLLSLGAHAYSVMVAAICLTFSAFIVRLLILKKLIDFSIRQFFKDVLFPIIAITILSSIVPILLYNILKDGLFRLLITTGISVMSICCSVYFLGINKNERQGVNNFIFNKIRKAV